MAPAHGSGGGKGGSDRNERVEREREKLDLISISIERNGAYTLEIWCIVQCHRVSPPLLLLCCIANGPSDGSVPHLPSHTHTYQSNAQAKWFIVFAFFVVVVRCSYCCCCCHNAIDAIPQ